MEIITMVAYLVIVWALCAVAAGAVLWAFGLAGYGLVKVWDWARPEGVAGQPSGRKHGRRAAGVKAFRPASILRRVYPLV